MSLFIGSVPNEVDPTEFEELFSKIGSCVCRIKVSATLKLSTKT